MSTPRGLSDPNDSSVENGAIVVMVVREGTVALGRRFGTDTLSPRRAGKSYHQGQLSILRPFRHGALCAYQFVSIFEGRFGGKIASTCLFIPDRFMFGLFVQSELHMQVYCSNHSDLFLLKIAIHVSAGRFPSMAGRPSRPGTRGRWPLPRAANAREGAHRSKTWSGDAVPSRRGW